VSVGKKRAIDPISYHRVDDLHLEIGHEGDVANFTYKKMGKAMLLSDLTVGRYYGGSSLRRLGIAKMMIDIAKEIAQKRGFAAIRISTEKKQWLKDMYEKLGFFTLSAGRSGATEMIYILDENVRDKFDPQDPYAILKYLR
jgi:GNAT superfamily N-acetyltransferase